MANLKAIRKRITSVRNTQKITRAMKLVAAAKLRRAQNAMTELRPYAQKHRELLTALVNHLAESGQVVDHPLMKARDVVKHVGIVVLTSDRGMCGGFNGGIVRRFGELLRSEAALGHSVSVFPLGRRASLAARKLRAEVAVDLGDILSATTTERVREIAKILVEAFTEERLDRVIILGNRFRSAISQIPTSEDLLPIVAAQESEPRLNEGQVRTDVLYEPGRSELLHYIVPRYVEVQIRQAILESIAGEHASRMNAMSNATDNASEMISSLTLELNRARQATITKELMEIIGGAEALK